MSSALRSFVKMSMGNLFLSFPLTPRPLFIAMLTGPGVDILGDHPSWCRLLPSLSMLRNENFDSRVVLLFLLLARVFFSSRVISRAFFAFVGACPPFIARSSPL